MTDEADVITPGAASPPAQREGRGSLRNRTLVGLLWTFSSTGLQGSIQLGVFVVLSRLLSPADFGLANAAMVVVAFTSVFSELGLGAALVQRQDIGPEHVRTCFTLSLLLGLVFTLSLWAIAPATALVFRMPALTPILRAVSLLFLFDSAALTARSLAQRRMDFQSLAIIETAAYGIGFGAVGVSLAVAGLGAWALVGAYLVQYMTTMVLLLVHKPHSMRPLIHWKTACQLLRFGVGFGLLQIGNWCALQGERLVVARCFGAESLGYYGRAYQLMALPPRLFGTVMARVLFPAVAEIQAESARMASVLRQSIAATCIFVLPLSAAVYVLAEEIVWLLMGPGWDEVVPPLKILAMAMFFRNAYKLCDTVARARGAVYRGAWREWVYAAAVVIGAWAGHYWGLPGVALGVLAAVVFKYAVAAHLCLSLMPLRSRDFAAAHIPGFVLGFLVYLELAMLVPFLKARSFEPLWICFGGAVLFTCTVVVALLLNARSFLARAPIATGAESSATPVFDRCTRERRVRSETSPKTRGSADKVLISVVSTEPGGIGNSPVELPASVPMGIVRNA